MLNLDDTSAPFNEGVTPRRLVGEPLHEFCMVKVGDLWAMLLSLWERGLTVPQPDRDSLRTISRLEAARPGDADPEKVAAILAFLRKDLPVGTVADHLARSPNAIPFAELELLRPFSPEDWKLILDHAAKPGLLSRSTTEHAASIMPDILKDLCLQRRLKSPVAHLMRFQYGQESLHALLEAAFSTDQYDLWEEFLCGLPGFDRQDFTEKNGSPDYMVRFVTGGAYWGLRKGERDNHRWRMPGDKECVGEVACRYLGIHLALLSMDNYSCYGFPMPDHLWETWTYYLKCVKKPDREALTTIGKWACTLKDARTLSAVCKALRRLPVRGHPYEDEAIDSDMIARALIDGDPEIVKITGASLRKPKHVKAAMSRACTKGNVEVIERLWPLPGWGAEDIRASNIDTLRAVLRLHQEKPGPKNIGETVAWSIQHRVRKAKAADMELRVREIKESGTLPSGVDAILLADLLKNTKPGFMSDPATSMRIWDEMVGQVRLLAALRVLPPKEHLRELDSLLRKVKKTSIRYQRMAPALAQWRALTSAG